jgi:sialidase-1
MQMLENEGTPRNRFKNDLILSVLQLVFALLFCAIFFIFLTSFGGEFLIVVKGLWILPLFLTVLVGGAIYSVVVSIMSLKSGKARGFLADGIAQPRTRKIWLVGWSVWNLVASIPILLVGKVLALGALGSVPNFLIVILMIPFIGFAVLLTGGSIDVLLGFLKRRGDIRLMKGAAIMGFAFLFVFASFGVLCAFWNPQWTKGVEHMALFVPGEEAGRGYRIPAMIVLPGDELLAFSESRVNAMSDLLDIDLVMKRSRDGGLTWRSLQVIQDVGRHTVHSPCPVFDEVTQTVWLPFCVDYENLYMMSSVDAGQIWSESRDLMQELGIIGEVWCHNGPGNGIQLSSGRLVIPTTLDEARVIYSDDHGTSWKMGEPIGKGSEPQVFERGDGSICANLRSQRGGFRIVACSDDGGETWGPWAYNEDLPAAGTQASILRFTTEIAGDRNRILFSNPGASYRGNLTLRMSYDEGETWEVSKLVYEGAAGYSQLAVLSDHTILVLFETGRFDLRQSITLARVDLEWLTDGKDRLASLSSAFLK